MHAVEAPSRKAWPVGRIAGTALAALLVLGLGSCSGAGEDQATTTTTAPATPPTDRTFRRHHWVSTTAVEGVDGLDARVSTSLTFPDTWTTTSRDEDGLVMKEGHGDCFYTVTARSRVVAAAGTTTARWAAESAPATGRYLLEEGTRDHAAWRVIRVPESGRFHVRAVRVEALVSASAREGVDLYLENSVEARSIVGGECHSGTWRDVLGPAVGDALATARTRAIVPAR